MTCRRSLFALLLFGLLGITAVAAEPFGVALLRPDSLAGWDYGPRPPAGWTIAHGRLLGSAGASPLLSGFSFNDVELRFQWSVSDGGQCKVLLAESPRGKGLELLLCEGQGCARLMDGERELAPGVAARRSTAMHPTIIRRSQNKLSVEVDGRKLYEVAVAADRRFGLGMAVAGKAEIADLRAEEPPGAPIFNGKDLAGWWGPGSMVRNWKAEEGELVLHPQSGNYIRSEKSYANFTLTLEYKMRKGGNSGIGIRTPHDGWPSGDGMELQFLDRPPGDKLDKHSTMAIYGNVPPLARTDRSEEWNRVVVKADGWMVSAWVNGELAQQYNTLDHPELKHRNLKGWIGFQDHGGGCDCATSVCWKPLTAPAWMLGSARRKSVRRRRSWSGS